MSSPDLAPFVAHAGRLADASGAIVRRYFRTPVAVDDKADASPVTIADREAETAMRTLTAAAYPGHGIIGEEFGRDRAEAEYVWVLDPIDGTKAFITGKPLFGTLIALTRRGVPVLGVIDQPVTRERWIGVAGERTRFNGAPVATRPCPGLDRAIVNTTSPDLCDAVEGRAFARLARRCRLAQYGGDCYAYGLVASGFLDLVVEAGLKAHDFCALVPVVAGAGGVMTDWSGRALDLASDGRVVAAGDRAALEAAIAVLTEA